MDLSKEEMSGGMRRLYANILIDAVQTVSRKTNMPMDQRTQKGRDEILNAERWIAGGVGLVTFEDVATELDLDPMLLRKRIAEVDYDTASKALRRRFVGSRYAVRKRLETMNDVEAVATEEERRLLNAQPVLPKSTELRVTRI